MQVFKKIKFKNLLNTIIGIFIFLVGFFISANYVLIRRLYKDGNMANNLFQGYILMSIGVFLLFFLLMAVCLFIIKRVSTVSIPYILDRFGDLCNFNFDASKNQFTPYFSEEEELQKYISNVFTEQAFIDQIRNIAASEYVLDDVLSEVFEKLNALIRVDRIGVAFVDYERGSIIAETAKINYGNILLGPGYEVKMERTSLTDMIQTKKPIFINDIEEEIKKRKRKNNSLELVMNEGIKSNMIIPLILEDQVFGFLFFSSFDKGSYDEKTLKIGENIAYSIASIIDQTYLTKKMLHNITITFAELVEKKDLETGNHIQRMTNYSKIIAEKLINYEKVNYRVNNSFVHEIELYAPLHDIGKVGIPDKILGKPAALTAEEWVVMKEHTNIGANILANLRDGLKIFRKHFYQMAIDITRHHHERWDGSGYPYGLKGEDIPLSARIIAIADVFDALSAKRPYKDPIPFDQAVEMIKEGSGTHFDPELVAVFIDCLPSIREVYNRDFGPQGAFNVKEQSLA